MNDKLLETVNLRANFYTYEGVVKALNGVSLVINHGSTFGLVGESGCGKSVTARAIMRIVQEPGRIESGKILVFLSGDQEAQGVDLMRQSEAYMERLRGNHISMIFQEPNSALNPILTIEDQISESFLIHQQPDMCREIAADLRRECERRSSPLKRLHISLFERQAERPDDLLLRVLNATPMLKLWKRRLKRKAAQKSIEVLGKLGIANPEQVITRYPHEISGGMKQRVVIAIGLACCPTLLIADEPTSNLDVTIQAQILELIKELKKKYISSVLLITHDLGVVAETCDRVGVMYAGNVCEVADVGDLFRAPKHPYSAALLNAVPKLSHTGELASIEGSVPNLVHPPSGCRFHPRCPRVMPVCAANAPDTVEIAPNHFVACYLYQKNPKRDGTIYAPSDN